MSENTSAVCDWDLVENHLRDSGEELKVICPACKTKPEISSFRLHRRTIVTRAAMTGRWGLEWDDLTDHSMHENESDDYIVCMKCFENIDADDFEQAVEDAGLRLTQELTKGQ